MFVEYRGSIGGILRWQWKYFAFFTLSAGAVVAAATFVPALKTHAGLPALPLGVIGGAIGIFASFRTNSAYDRWWEGRKLWGALVNASRHWATQALCYVDASVRDRLVRRHVVYVHVLRCLLRQQDPTADEELRRLASDELEQACASSNPTHFLLHQQMLDLAAEAAAGRLDRFHQLSMDQTIRGLLDVQGGCERIKKTPFPRGYGFIAERLILAFSILFPLGLVGEMGWLAIPISVLVCTGFLLISEVGRVLEDPFTTFWPALPLSALATTIETNLRERLGDVDLPPAPKPIPPGVLM